MNQNTSNTSPKQWLTRLILLALIIFIMYLIFGDEDQAVRNMVRGIIRVIARAL